MKRYEVLFIELDETVKNQTLREKLEELRQEVEKEIVHKECLEEMA